MRREIKGFHHLPGFVRSDDVTFILETVRAICTAAPLRTPTMPDGRPLHLQVTNAGQWGWWADRGGYRYVDKHPTTGALWPPIPSALLGLHKRALEETGHQPFTPDNMLINYYKNDGSLGLHVDKTEDDHEAPIVGISIGADALFHLGGFDRRDKVDAFTLSSGDAVVQGGISRRCFHGIVKILPTLTSPVRDGGRVNITFRKVRL